jgi:hypothetical protein
MVMVVIKTDLVAESATITDKSRLRTVTEEPDDH